MCCRVLQRLAVRCNVLHRPGCYSVLQYTGCNRCDTVCCGVLQVCNSALQVCCGVLACVLQCVVACWGVLLDRLQYNVVCCSVVRCVAVMWVCCRCVAGVLQRRYRCVVSVLQSKCENVNIFTCTLLIRFTQICTFMHAHPQKSSIA